MFDGADHRRNGDFSRGFPALLLLGNSVAIPDKSDSAQLILRFPDPLESGMFTTV